MARGSAIKSPCIWLNQKDAFTQFAGHTGGTESAKHIKPLHWYVACRLVLEGGFDPDFITPRPPFRVEKIPARTSKGRRTPARAVLIHDANLGGTGEQVILGGLKTKNVDVVVTNPKLGPVIAVSCKGITKSFRNLTNRMEETIGECTNLHITYPAMVIGYYALLRANRTLQDALEAPDAEDETGTVDKAEDQEEVSDEGSSLPDLESLEPTAAVVASPEIAGARADFDPVTSKPALAKVLPRGKAAERIEANDIAVVLSPDGETATDSIKRFYSALSEMTSRHGIRDEISRYEAISIALVEPKGSELGNVFPGFPPPEGTLHHGQFFATLYKRYEERFVYGAPLLAERGITTRFQWDPDSPVFEGVDLDFIPRIAGA